MSSNSYHLLLFIQFTLRRLIRLANVAVQYNVDIFKNMPEHDLTVKT